MVGPACQPHSACCTVRRPPCQADARRVGDADGLMTRPGRLFVRTSPLRTPYPFPFPLSLHSLTLFLQSSPPWQPSNAASPGQPGISLLGPNPPTLSPGHHPSSCKPNPSLSPSNAGNRPSSLKSAPPSELRFRPPTQHPPRFLPPAISPRLCAPVRFCSAQVLASVRRERGVRRHRPPGPAGPRLAVFAQRLQSASPSNSSCRAAFVGLRSSPRGPSPASPDSGRSSRAAAWRRGRVGPAAPSRLQGLSRSSRCHPETAARSFVDSIPSPILSHNELPPIELSSSTTAE
ncbi:hypothetical protein PR202_gb25707 [Eleusine coracana subsp. coracana]|uniref:Uncharacterized protein n=1 Tax=Eleusine coracana subsp. coracana TaxID=191504 RepID=A0AAV5FRB2_ELECO|nr:hypothetical protein PR202_gb25707 [Eleusine coracana subsp. coracana]